MSHYIAAKLQYGRADFASETVNAGQPLQLCRADGFGVAHNPQNIGNIVFDAMFEAVNRLVNAGHVKLGVNAAVRATAACVQSTITAEGPANQQIRQIKSILLT